MRSRTRAYRTRRREGSLSSPQVFLPWQSYGKNGSHFARKLPKVSLKFDVATAKKLESFFPGTCASGKILLSHQTCERSECAADGCKQSNESPAKRVSFEAKKISGTACTVPLFPFLCRPGEMAAGSTEAKERNERERNKKERKSCLECL